MALPREFDYEVDKAVIESFIKDNFTDHGFAAVYAIHDKGDGNPHAHILVPNRAINERGEWEAKRKMEYVLDKDGQRIPKIDKETGLQKVDAHGRRQWERVNAERNPLDAKEKLKEIRKDWADQCNRYLEKEQQIDHRSLADQGIEKIPTIHEGYAAREIERKGGIADRCQENRDIREHNSLLDKVKEALQQFQHGLQELFSRRERKRAKELSEYNELLAIAKKDVKRSFLDRLTDKIVLPKDPYIEQLRDELFRLANEHLVGGKPQTERYHELNAIVSAYDERQKCMYEAIKEGLENHLSDEDLYAFVQEKVSRDKEAREHPAVDREEDELER